MPDFLDEVIGAENGVGDEFIAHGRAQRRGCGAMHRFSVQRAVQRRSEIRNAACGKRNSGGVSEWIGSVSPTGDGLHVCAIVFDFGAASEKHDAELFEECLGSVACST